MKMKLALLHVKRSMIQIAVVAIAAIVVLGPASPFTAQAISAPILVSPANGITTTVGNYPPAAMPYFTWQPVTGATNYRIQVSSDIAFTILELDVITPNTQYIPTSISAFPDNTWYWRVRVEAPLPVSSWSEIRQFTKQWADPSNAPTLLAPSNNATI